MQFCKNLDLRLQTLSCQVSKGAAPELKDILWGQATTIRGRGTDCIDIGDARPGRCRAVAAARRAVPNPAASGYPGETGLRVSRCGCAGGGVEEPRCGPGARARRGGARADPVFAEAGGADRGGSSRGREALRTASGESPSSCSPRWRVSASKLCREATVPEAVPGCGQDRQGARGRCCSWYSHLAKVSVRFARITSGELVLCGSCGTSEQVP